MISTTRRMALDKAQRAGEGSITAQVNVKSGGRRLRTEQCGIIVTVGFLMAGATETASKANPIAKSAIVDNAYSPPLSNVDALLFTTVQDGFLGGYLAAGMTKTGKVATIGGQKLPTVTIYIDGFYDGVQYYNSKHGTHVSVPGWNEGSQNGSFTGNFTDQTAGQTLTQTFITEGADIIFPVAGNVGLGAAKAVQNADAQAGSQKVNMMWVDTDGCISAAQYCKYFITPAAAGTVGINVRLTRYRNVILAGLVAGIGGAFLTIGSVGSFGKDMPSGKGYIALAAMIFGRWTPLGGVGAALLFGFTFELQSILSTINVPIASYFLLMVPYVATIIAVAGLVGQVRAPAADGQPYITS